MGTRKYGGREPGGSRVLIGQTEIGSVPGKRNSAGITATMVYGRPFKVIERPRTLGSEFRWVRQKLLLTTTTGSLPGWSSAAVKAWPKIGVAPRVVKKSAVTATPVMRS